MGLHQFVTLAVEFFICAAWLGAWIEYFHDENLPYKPYSRSGLSWPVIRDISPVFAWAISQADRFGLRWMMGRMQNAAG